jgi:hypothetical protein
VIHANSELQLRYDDIILLSHKLMLRACLFGLSVAGCGRKADVQRKLLCRESCCFEFYRLATWMAG